MTSMDLVIAEVKRDLRENRMKRKQYDGARCMFRPATWAEEAATVYHMLPSLESVGIPTLATLILNLLEYPTAVLIDSTSMEEYLDIIASGQASKTLGNNIVTYQEVFTKLAPTLSSLIIVEDGNRFLDVLRSQGKTVKSFFQWSVGDYPLPNLHTHLVFQSIPKDG